MSKLSLAAVLPILRGAPYFTKQNIALAFNKEGEALNYWIKKLLKEKALLSVKKGIYISAYYKDLVSQNQADIEGYFEYLANTFCYPSYVSLEYVLAKNGFIPESPFTITSITIKSSRVYNSKIGSFIYRNLKQDFFYGWIETNFKDKKIKAATLPKAMFDFFYLRNLTVDWKDYLLEGGRFNWEVLTKKDKEEFENIINKSNVRKMKMLFQFLRKEKLL